MEKDEILAKSRNEYREQDERQKSIEEKAQSNAFSLIITVFAFLTVISYVLKLFIGRYIFPANVFTLALLLGFSGKFMTNYYYNRKTSDLVVTVIVSIGAVAGLISIILQEIG